MRSGRLDTAEFNYKEFLASKWRFNLPFYFHFKKLPGGPMKPPTTPWAILIFLCLHAPRTSTGIGFCRKQKSPHPLHRYFSNFPFPILPRRRHKNTSAANNKQHINLEIPINQTSGRLQKRVYYLVDGSRGLPKTTNEWLDIV